jgi:putative transposase
VERLKQAGYTVKDGCQALGISRSGYYAAREPKGRPENISELRDSGLLEKMKAIKLEHPFWGYRRVWARHP